MSPKKTKKTRRYNLIINEDLFDEVKDLAETRGEKVVDLFRLFIKLGLLALQITDDPDAKLIIREGESERELLLI